MVDPYIELGLAAIQYTRSQGILASNREHDRRLNHDLDAAVTAASMEYLRLHSEEGDRVIEEYRRNNNRGPTEVSWQNEMKLKARAAVSLGAGNCESQSAVAFGYLAALPNHPKLEMMSVDGRALPDPFVVRDWPVLNQATDRYELEQQIHTPTGYVPYEGPDHVFVVINRVAGQITNPDTWNHNAVVCDPWAKRCYRANRLQLEMQLIGRVTGGITRFTQMHELAAGAAW
ncbi:hypothetical protein KVG96_06590 [Pseudomonas sp. COR58]|uniref:Uncharacterized protein n=1 Tax=Pseudomonas ekonensis TaxID=2842353 RepID=A0ABS6PAX9_9PSED|nr:hypothetical protein [Pseudomonas ekonensis]MBV4457615.1 hypothetical protein [Pseudomonas ekonensis]